MKVFDSSTGFLLPDGSMRSSDAAVVDLLRRMAAYQANGAYLGWLLVPEERAPWRCGPPRASRCGWSIRSNAVRHRSSQNWSWSLRRSGRPDGGTCHQYVCDQTPRSSWSSSLLFLKMAKETDMGAPPCS